MKSLKESLTKKSSIDYVVKFNGIMLLLERDIFNIDINDIKIGQRIKCNYRDLSYLDFTIKNINTNGKPRVIFDVNIELADEFNELISMSTCIGID